MRKALVTVTIGAKFKAVAAVTHPTLKAYADRIGAEFIVLDENKTEFVPHFAKLQLQELLGTYARAVFVDTDIVIRDDCPDLFELVPENRVGLFREGAFIPRRLQDLEMASRTYQTQIRMDPNTWKGQYWNTGVLVCSRRHRMLFTPPDFEKVKQVAGAWDYGEQGWLNLQIINSSTPIYDLNHRFNRMTIMDPFVGIHRRNSYCIHYAGAPDQIPQPNGRSISLPQFIQRDLDAWKQEGPAYGYRRHILITVGGGLGDQLEAEPVVRYLREEMYPDAVIRVISDWPRIFLHLAADPNFDVKTRSETVLEPDQPYYRMETLPIPESRFGRLVSHPLVHSVDYSALSCLKTTLPNDRKQIKLQTTPEDVAVLLQSLDTRNFRDLVLVHPGRGWPSKTFPKDYWEAVLTGLLDRDLTPCLIGRSMAENRGLVAVDRPEGCLDLRDRTTLGALFLAIGNARVTITNDSAPLHIAGAFDNCLLCIPTCKHPDHIMPWRKGRQTHKAVALYKDLTIAGLDNRPTNLYGQTVDEIPGGDIRPFLPNPNQVAEKARELFEISKAEDD